ncbi:cyclase (plasmid) [Pseudonocardia sp. EC080619-01]|uniref:aromatase/cyclase n=1 Tax=Pseudonocardia sp. EC080619-01 TaxID=1096856 RepID=UPI000705AF7B|nr:aromatase/cyclase [Pseudonocardia sp. EC080619-01]ALL85567.1 cyclase [Pseudonocardia sp. EC080619-01]
MYDNGHRHIEHEIMIEAPAAGVYQLLAEVENWPRMFPPSVHVECLERSRGSERIQIWATANGDAKTWISRRDLEADALRIEFRQEAPTAPIAAMGGTWIVEPRGDESSRVRLLHDYRALDDDLEALDWIDKAVDRNSTTELHALKGSAEAASGGSDNFFSFTDSIHVQGCAKDMFDFINDAAAWEQKLPHVARVQLDEDTPGLQVLEMDTHSNDGSVHTTKSIRVTFPHERIVYKQIRVPTLMTLHTGLWKFTEDTDGILASSRHDVMINEENIASVLGPEAGMADARAYVQKALSTNSLATLDHARDYAEKRR